MVWRRVPRSEVALTTETVTVNVADLEIRSPRRVPRRFSEGPSPAQSRAAAAAVLELVAGPERRAGFGKRELGTRFGFRHVAQNFGVELAGSPVTRR